MTTEAKAKQREYLKKWRAANREKCRQYAIRYREANREYLREYWKSRYGKKKLTNAAWRAKNPGKCREYILKRIATESDRPYRLLVSYGLTPAGFEALEKAQSGLCAICRQPETAKRRRRLSVDHDHKTGAVRGLLCGNCNKGIGCLKDSPELLARAMEYLMTAQKSEVA